LTVSWPRPYTKGVWDLQPDGWGMTQIFISYSKQHRDLTERFATLFQREGWSVWYDRELDGVDLYEPEIARHLKQADLAVVFWTDGACRSAWVYSEATAPSPPASC